MSRLLLFVCFLTYNLILSQMTELPVDKIYIGFADSSVSKTKVELEYIDHKFFVFSFKDEKNQYNKKFTSLSLSETWENMEGFRKSVFKDFTNDNVKEKLFKSGDYEIHVIYFGKGTERSVSLMFENKKSTEIFVTPLLEELNWFTLFMDLEKAKS